MPSEDTPSHIGYSPRPKCLIYHYKASPNTTLLSWFCWPMLAGLSPQKCSEDKPSNTECSPGPKYFIWAAPSEFVSSSIPSWQISTAHAQPFRGARDLAFCLKVPLDSLLVWASSEGSGETARMRRLAWTFAARIGDKYQIRLARPIYQIFPSAELYYTFIILLTSAGRLEPSKVFWRHAISYRIQPRAQMSDLSL